jgi:two-component system, LuxR family, sensor kinase FixL
LSADPPDLRFDADRIRAFLDKLERLAGGDTEISMPISALHDELDAIAHGINVVAGELRWAHEHMIQSERVNAEIQAATLRDELAHLARTTTLDALAGSLAHEIDQPLTAVAANAEAALRLVASQHSHLREVRAALSDILSDNKRAAAVLQRVRALLKKNTPGYESVDLNSTIGDVAELVRSTAASRRIQLNVELASAIGPVRGDRIQIQQVALNLLMNAFDAVQACETADRRVRVRTSLREPWASVDVIDQGIGVSDDRLRTIFEPFHTTKPDGMGLGLSICRGIVTAHGGILEVARNPSRGMTFSARFPLFRSFQAD